MQKRKSMKVKTTKRHCNRWSSEEEQKLKFLVDHFTTSSAAGDGVKWADISKQLPGRDSRACRHHWVNVCRPGMKSGSWTQEEERQLAELHSVHGSSWALMARHIEGRSENSIKNHWNVLIRSPVLQKRQDSILARYIQLLDTVPDITRREAYEMAERQMQQDALSTPFGINQLAAGACGGPSQPAAAPAAAADTSQITTQQSSAHCRERCLHSFGKVDTPGVHVHPASSAHGSRGAARSASGPQSALQPDQLMHNPDDSPEMAGGSTYVAAVPDPRPCPQSQHDQEEGMLGVKMECGAGGPTQSPVLSTVARAASHTLHGQSDVPFHTSQGTSPPSSSWSARIQTAHQGYPTSLVTARGANTAAAHCKQHVVSADVVFFSHLEAMHNTDTAPATMGNDMVAAVHVQPAMASHDATCAADQCARSEVRRLILQIQSPCRSPPDLPAPHGNASGHAGGNTASIRPPPHAFPVYQRPLPSSAFEWQNDPFRPAAFTEVNAASHAAPHPGPAAPQGFTVHEVDPLTAAATQPSTVCTQVPFTNTSDCIPHVATAANSFAKTSLSFSNLCHGSETNLPGPDMLLCDTNTTHNIMDYEWSRGVPSPRDTNSIWSLTEDCHAESVPPDARYNAKLRSTCGVHERGTVWDALEVGTHQAVPTIAHLAASIAGPLEHYTQGLRSMSVVRSSLSYDLQQQHLKMPARLQQATDCCLETLLESACTTAWSGVGLTA